MWWYLVCFYCFWCSDGSIGYCYCACGGTGYISTYDTAGHVVVLVIIVVVVVLLGMLY